MAKACQLAFIGLWLLNCAGLWSPADALKCYTDIEATQITRCKESEGFRTCFTKYNDKGQVTGRGCSTKDKVFYKECETHSYGEQVEKMCFCSYFLCNLSTAVAPPSCLLLLIIGASLCVLNESHCQTTTCSHDYRTIDIDICDNIIALANGKKEETASISEKTTPKSCQHLLLQRTIKSSRAVS